MRPSIDPIGDLLPSREELYRTLVETSPDGIVLTSPAGEILLLNQRAVDLYGASHPDELLGLNVHDLVKSDQPAQPVSNPDEAYTPDNVRDLEFVLPTKDGGSYPAEVRVSAIRDDQGQVVAFLSVIRDVTERKKAVKALRESEERFRLTFDLAAIGIAHVSPEGRWLRVNQGICSMLGYTREELLGSYFQDVTHPDDLQQNLGHFNGLMSGNVPSYVFEKRYIRKDGSIVWANVTTSVVRDTGGEPQYSISVIEDISERKRLEERLRHQALHDALTNLPNRTLLYDRLEQAIRSAHRNHSSCALLLLDLDRFKEINDTFGHHCGDLLLQEMSLRLQRALRQSDTIARLGGDEFAVLLPHTDEAGAVHAAEKLQKALSEPIELEGDPVGTPVDVQASIGAAVYPRDGEDADTLMRRADVAMYLAKRVDQNCSLYDANRDPYSPTRLALISALRHAIDNDLLDLYYQPKVDLKSGRILGVEALARWPHPQFGFIPPDQFIPLAEHTGLIRPLTLWVLDRALAQCRAWQDAGLDLSVAVNLSARNLRDPDLVSAISGSLQAWGVEAGRLVVELTESVVMSDPDHATEVLGRLHDMGVQIAMDDFGTGYSSLAYLKRLPVDEIKIDKSFVLDLADNDEDCFIVRSVADLGHSLGLDVLAEGVENQQSVRLLAMMGCDLAQGYHFGRPVPARELTTLLTEHQVQAAP
jgi:diguanylate cyclase (GGDEF)-like protein/PAS domain S-box-containing protein